MGAPALLLFPWLFGVHPGDGRSGCVVVLYPHFFLRPQILPKRTLEIQGSTPAERAAQSQQSLSSPPQHPALCSVGITERAFVLFFLPFRSAQFSFYSFRWALVLFLMPLPSVPRKGRNSAGCTPTARRGRGQPEPDRPSPSPLLFLLL